MKNYQLRKYEILTEKFAKMGQTMVHHQSGYLGLNADAGEGRVNRVGQPKELPQGDVGDVASALAYVQKVAELHPDDFSRWAPTSDILKKVSGDSVRKVNVNRSGQTQNPLVYPANAESSQAGSRKTITTDELSHAEQLKRLEDSAKDLFEQHRMAEGHLKARILHVSKL
jgi:hypothetical protein